MAQEVYHHLIDSPRGKRGEYRLDRQCIQEESIRVELG